jgi:hypothetical protein
MVDYWQCQIRILRILFGFGKCRLALLGVQLGAPERTSPSPELAL